MLIDQISASKPYEAQIETIRAIKAKVYAKPKPVIVEALPSPIEEKRAKREAEWLKQISIPAPIQVIPAPPKVAPFPKVAICEEDGDKRKEIASSAPVSLGELVRVVCWLHGVEVAAFASPRKNRRLVYARYHYYYLAYKFTEKSFPQVGRAVGGRDHTTVLAGRRRWLEIKANKYREYRELKEKLMPLGKWVRF